MVPLSSTERPTLNCAGKRLDLSCPVVMGVLNVTPDSFSDGGHFFEPEAALRRAEEMAEEGAALIDIGGESTRPGARFVSAQEEIDRVVPLVQRLVTSLDVPISIDTSKPAVMREALRVGAGMINDVRALQEPGALTVLAEHTYVPVCLMHMRGVPATMQQAPHYGDVVAEVKAFLGERIRVCQVAGIERKRLIIDPGFGFGKTLQHNLLLLKHLTTFHDLGVPLLVGLSRKSMIGALLDAPLADRMHGSVAAAVIAAWQGARIIRAHDVKPTVQALKICSAVQMIAQPSI